MFFSFERQPAIWKYGFRLFEQWIQILVARGVVTDKQRGSAREPGNFRSLLSGAVLGFCGLQLVGGEEGCFVIQEVYAFNLCSYARVKSSV